MENINTLLSNGEDIRLYLTEHDLDESKFDELISESFSSEVYISGDFIYKISKTEYQNCLDETGCYSCSDTILLEALALSVLNNPEYFQEMTQVGLHKNKIFLKSKFSYGDQLSTITITKKESMIISFQILYVLATCQNYKFVHGDLIENNIFIEHIEEQDMEFTIFKDKYIIKNCSIKVRLIDFEFSRFELENDTYVFNKTIKDRYYPDDDFVKYYPQIDIFKILTNPKISKGLDSNKLYKLTEGVNVSSGYKIIPPFTSCSYEDVFKSGIFDYFKIKLSFDEMLKQKDYIGCSSYLNNIGIPDNINTLPPKLKNIAKMKSIRNTNKAEIFGYNFIEGVNININDWLNQDKDNFVFVCDNNKAYCLNKNYFALIDENLILNEAIYDGNILSYVKSYNSIQFVNLLNYGLDVIVSKRFLLKALKTEDIIDLKFKRDVYCISREFMKYNPRTYVLNKQEYVGFTEDEYKSLNNYTNKWNYPINTFLRTGEEYFESEPYLEYHKTYGNDIESSIQNVKIAIENIDSAFRKTLVSLDRIILYRGLEKEEFLDIDQINLGYISTSKNLNVVEEFSAGIIIEYHLSEGIPYIEINTISHFPYENEILLPRNLISHFKEKKGNIYVIDLFLENSKQFDVNTEYRKYKLYDIIGYEEEDKKESDSCKNNILEDDILLDPTTFEEITDIISIGNTCYNKSTIKKIIDLHNDRIFFSIEDELLDPYTRNPLPQEIIDQFPNIYLRSDDSKDFENIPDYVEFLHTQRSEMIYKIGKLANLKYLNISFTNLSNISPLSNLINITNFILSNNQISDISALSNLINITELSLSNNRISNISSLSKLINITYLDLSNNQISDISALSKLINITGLVLSNNQISNISILSKLINITGLGLANNQISNISGLSNSINIRYLDLSNNQISNISSLSKLINISNFILSNNQISDILVLSNLINIAELSLSNNRISNISSLSKLINITELSLSNNKIKDFSALSDLINIINLDLSNNRISNISSLSKLINITDLNLSNNKIKDLSVLFDLINITNLDLSNNKISDVSPLSDLINIMSLNLSDNKIFDVSALSNLINLTYLDLTNNLIKDFSVLSNFPKLNN